MAFAENQENLSTGMSPRGRTVRSGSRSRSLPEAPPQPATWTVGRAIYDRVTSGPARGVDQAPGRRLSDLFSQDPL